MKSRQWDPARGIFEWEGEVQVEASVHATADTETLHGKSTREVLSGTGTARWRQVTLKISLAEGYSSLHWGVPEPIRGRRMGSVVDRREVPETVTWDEEVPDINAVVPHLARMIGNVYTPVDWFSSVANGPRAFTISSSLPDSHRLAFGGCGWDPPAHRATVVLTPIYEELEVEVKIEGYETWRPEGSIEQPTRPGNSLLATATLVPKNEAAARNPPAVRRFTFHLGEVSREPGVCLNWPLEAKDNHPDLRLAMASVPGELVDDDSELRVDLPRGSAAGRPYADARIDAYDFGARGHLIVLCELEDGRVLTGVLRTSGGEKRLVNLPRQDKTPWIADVWSQAHGTTMLRASDDSDDKPVGDGNKGDGYTLYEEYRGFVENGRRIEGDPKRKDFFVLNLIGADARPGIELFENISELRVHSRLRRTEMSKEKRLMNGNHREAPHRVDQHGVWIKQFALGDLPGLGAYTALTKQHVAGRPGITYGIALLARDEPLSDFNRPVAAAGENVINSGSAIQISTRDAVFAYDRAIAHELLHSVGVEHHGEGNERKTFWFIHANDPMNAQRTSRFVASQPKSVVEDDGMGEFRRPNPGPTLTLIEEGSGRDLTASYRAFQERLINQLRASANLMAYFRTKGAWYAQRNAWSGKPAEWWTERLLHEAGGLDLHIGVPQGEDSGDQDCVMRYYFAKAYPLKGRQHDFVYIPPGTNPIGVELCRSAKGTGVNSSSHQPQSRHGDAAAGHGNCAHQICPNDAIPPRKV